MSTAEAFLRKKFIAKRSSTKGRLDKNREPIEFRLTFEQWCQLWADAGVRPAAPFVLSRKDDVGHYEIDNVYVSHNLLNVTEQQGDQTELDAKINAYAIQTGYKRRIVKNMLKRGELEL
jgi:hypothetical protein